MIWRGYQNTTQTMLRGRLPRFLFFPNQRRGWLPGLFGGYQPLLGAPTPYICCKMLQVKHMRGSKPVDPPMVLSVASLCLAAWPRPKIVPSPLRNPLRHWSGRHHIGSSGECKWILVHDDLCWEPTRVYWCWKFQFVPEYSSVFLSTCLAAWGTQPELTILVCQAFSAQSFCSRRGKVSKQFPQEIKYKL